MFVLPFATQIKHESGTPIPDGALKQEVTFCVQGVISPLLSNLYLNEVDKMLERAREVTRNGKYTNVEYARFADDLVVLINAYKRHDWLIGAVNKRLREEFAKLQVEINDEKSRRVDLERGENFGFLGFDFRYLRSLRGVMRPHYTPKLKKRTALLRELKEVFRRHRSQPIERVISLINPMLRGWVNYFAVGNSSECFAYIRDWVEKKVRRHLAHARKPQPMFREARSGLRTPENLTRYDRHPGGPASDVVSSAPSNGDRGRSDDAEFARLYAGGKRNRNIDPSRTTNTRMT